MSLGISAATWAGIGAVGSIGVGLVNGANSADAAQDANATVQQSNQAAIAEQRRQFDAVQQLLAPFQSAGTGALTGQQNLLGLNGTGAQQQAYSEIQNSPAFQALQKSGETSILQNASATGGLRGGNTQSALAQFSPQLLSQMIEQQYSRLGGLTSIGQNAAAGVGNAGMQTGNNISTLLGASGSSGAASILAQARAENSGLSGISSGIGSLAGLGSFGTFGGSAGLASLASSQGGDSMTNLMRISNGFGTGF